MTVQSDIKRCVGYNRAGIAPHWTSVSNFHKNKWTKDGLCNFCKDCAKAKNTVHNPAANANPKYDPARARARERRQQLVENAWIEPGWNKAKSLAFWGRHCHICLEDIEGPIEYDHVVPVSRGGEHSVANVRPAHPVCNAWKHDKLMEELDLTKVPQCVII